MATTVTIYKLSVDGDMENTWTDTPPWPAICTGLFKQRQPSDGLLPCALKHLM